MLTRIFLYLMLSGAIITLAYAELAHAELPGDIPREALGEHTIKAGDNLYIIARQYKVDIRNIIRANELKPPYVIRIGDKLQIPGSPYHTVKRGDSLSGIARKYKVGVRAIVVLNKLKEPYVIYPRQKIYIPEPKPSLQRTTAAKAPEAPKTVTPKITGASLQVAPLPPNWNPPKPSPPSQKISLGQAPLPPSPPSQASSASASSAPPAPPVPPSPKQKVSRIFAPLPPTQNNPAPAVTVADFVDNGAPFLPPVNGKIISGFGAKGLGVHNDGVNFATKKGEAVRSSRDGTVAYSDNKLRRLGNLIIVRHAGGYMTVYAHNHKNLVKSGDRVRRGQVIATAGSSGGVNQPQLHFQILKDEQAINPIKYIGG